MMTVELSPKNPIVRFVTVMRERMGREWKPFPDDICALGRSLFLNALLFALFAFVAGFLVVSFLVFWVSAFTYGLHPYGSVMMALFFGFGSIASILLLFLGGGALVIWFFEITSMGERVKESLADTVYNAGAGVRNWKRTSAVYALWRSFKDKTCFYVRVREN